MSYLATAGGSPALAEDVPTPSPVPRHAESASPPSADGDRREVYREKEENGGRKESVVRDSVAPGKRWAWDEWEEEEESR